MQYNLPIFMTIGDKVIYSLPQIITDKFRLSLPRKILFFSTAGLMELYGQQVQALSGELPGMQIREVKSSSFEAALQAAKDICLNGFNMVIGFGGGTVLDTAKFASFIAKVPYIAVPTVLSNDGLASPVAVLYTGNNRKRSFGSKIPNGLVIDTDIVSRAPRDLLKAGIGDTVSNYTALYDWKLDSIHRGTATNDFAYMLAETAFNSLLYNEEKSLESKQFLHVMAQALVLSGIAMEIAGNTRPCSGSEHLFSHALDEKYDLAVPHGLLVALGSVAACILQGRDPSILLKYLKSYGISVNPKDLGITKEMFVQAWLTARHTRPDRFTVLNTLKLYALLFENIYYQLLEV